MSYYDVHFSLNFTVLFAWLLGCLVGWLVGFMLCQVVCLVRLIGNVPSAAVRVDTILRGKGLLRFAKK